MTKTDPAPNNPDEHSPDDDLEDYGGGQVQARHGRLPIWLLVVYGVMFLWGLYYAYQYWGGIGPGRIG
ncbi:hypothetical protein [Mesorhizobium sp. L-8-3]|uniref:hypothetical protein n=1 Tax=Mesorhizobium sp. L-8-3 TaxID=2744522 RepID=UPI001925D3E2|nr:hypothetical protein [Mesorhizobium sp. L-8-3]BCH22790.1 hypothetical protein MesoLjLb_25750 [Mesorhizobium sp. L-8-3]